MGFLLWPFRVIWFFTTFLFKLMGRLVSAIVGLIFLVAGFILTLTFIGAFVGIPLIIIGFLLLMCAILI